VLSFVFARCSLAVLCFNFSIRQGDPAEAISTATDCCIASRLENRGAVSKVVAVFPAHPVAPAHVEPEHGVLARVFEIPFLLS
jgi:hypothetical protein